VVVRGTIPPIGLGSIGNNFDFSSDAYDENDTFNQGYSNPGILNSLSFGMAMSSVFSALGGGGGDSPLLPPRQL